MKPLECLSAQFITRFPANHLPTATALLSDTRDALRINVSNSGRLSHKGNASGRVISQHLVLSLQILGLYPVCQLMNLFNVARPAPGVGVLTLHCIY